MDPPRPGTYWWKRVGDTWTSVLVSVVANVANAASGGEGSFDYTPQVIYTPQVVYEDTRHREVCWAHPLETWHRDFISDEAHKKQLAAYDAVEEKTEPEAPRKTALPIESDRPITILGVYRAADKVHVTVTTEHAEDLVEKLVGKLIDQLLKDKADSPTSLRKTEDVPTGLVGTESDPAKAQRQPTKEDLERAREHATLAFSRGKALVITAPPDFDVVTLATETAKHFAGSADVLRVGMVTTGVEFSTNTESSRGVLIIVGQPTNAKQLDAISGLVMARSVYTRTGISVAKMAPPPHVIVADNTDGMMEYFPEETRNFMRITLGEEV
jgi:hypothetical protein